MDDKQSQISKSQAWFEEYDLFLENLDDVNKGGSLDTVPLLNSGLHLLRREGENVDNVVSRLGLDFQTIMDWQQRTKVPANFIEILDTISWELITLMAWFERCKCDVCLESEKEEAENG